jgi:hypothetical protein
LQEAHKAHPKPVATASEGQPRLKAPGEDPAYDAWFREQVEIGLAEADRGELVSDEAVRAEWQGLRAELLRQAKDGK